MLKTLMGAGALLLTTAAVPAAAHDWDGYGYGRYDSGGGYYYNVVRQHVQECRQHERFHEQLDALHGDAHDEGFDGRDEHDDLHDALDQAHGDYHADHPGLRNCGYWYSQYNNMTRGYRGYWGYHRYGGWNY
ncbi:MAG: hypothetical protein ISS15_06915 [Alphaproteobacteria bacterium]|nr:hypothetical protein [Alphaproteobacteria bacterium]MBL7097369.1 hypothetical protein [Alphaproteobacteria bacterium]